MSEGAVAIVGMSCRVPGAGSVREYWQNLCAGVESITPLTDDHLRRSGVAAVLIDNPAYVKAAASLGDVAAFASQFFGISAREADIMDPQHRLFLEGAWEALEDAGYVPDQFRGRIAVYAGTGLNTYLFENLLPNPELLHSLGPLPLLIANRADFLPPLVSYRLNLTGESVNVSTACSTSLVAVHMACRSLLAYDSDMVLAGGATVAATQERGYLYQQEGAFAPDGRCRPFDASARGTVPGNGVGVVVLKRLEDALSDRDNIVAVIRSSAVNNDGAAKVGFTAPSIAGQREVIASALALANVPARTIGYVETHGTGTLLGDPIEIRALSEAFRDASGPAGSCAIGSVKSNIGHIDAAAGVASLIKAALCLSRRTLVASLNFATLNPEIDFTGTPFFVNTRLRAWEPPPDETPRRAGVSSFGIGGTNAHVILEEAPLPRHEDSHRRWQILGFSARGPAELERQVENFISHVADNGQLPIADAAYTLHLGRREFEHRQALIADGSLCGGSAMPARNTPRSLAAIAHKPARPLAFLFPGVGDHYPGMGRNLYREEPVFRRHLDRCAELLRPRLQLDLRTLLFAVDPAPQQPSDWLFERPEVMTAAMTSMSRTEVLHPTLFALQYALAQLWIDWLGPPSAMIGYSLGEYTAACIAGVMELPEALTLVAERAKLIARLPKGRMLAVAQGESDLRSVLPPDLSLAAVNGPTMTVVAGAAAAVAAFEQSLRDRGVASRPVMSEHALHSSMMDEAVSALRALFAAASLSPPAIPFVSNVSGEWITAQEATDPDRWARHIAETVRFGDGLARLRADAPRLQLEIGPGRTLGSLVRLQDGASRDTVTLPTLPTAREPDADTVVCAQTLASLWCHGQAVDWRRYHAAETRARISLPTYPFERQRHWIDAPNAPPRVWQAPAADMAREPSSPAPAAEAEASGLEAAVLGLWRELFRVESIELDDNFFAIGGNSLLAIQLLTRLRSLYQVELPLKNLFQAPTVRGVANALEAALLSELQTLSEEEVQRRLGATSSSAADAAANDVALIAREFVLPNGLRVQQYNQAETEHFYHDIFENKVYHRHGISIPDAAVIFDVGANIGLFSLYAGTISKSPRIYAFEPAPPVFALLQENLRRNGVDAELFNYGVADRADSRTLTFYPRSTGMSSFHANLAEEREVLYTIMENQSRQGSPEMSAVMNYADQLLEQRLIARDYECRIVSISEIVRRCGVRHIDLIKIDVQKCELEVLAGIDDEHWPHIRQLVVEVHDFDGRVARIEAMLRERGFQLICEQDSLYRNSNISNLYALRR